jgi:hypothetical protein
MSGTLVFDFVEGTISIRDPDGESRPAPDVVELTAAGVQPTGGEPSPE